MEDTSDKKETRGLRKGHSLLRHRGRNSQKLGDRGHGKYSSSEAEGWNSPQSSTSLVCKRSQAELRGGEMELPNIQRRDYLLN